MGKDHQSLSRCKAPSQSPTLTQCLHKLWQQQQWQQQQYTSNQVPQCCARGSHVHVALKGVLQGVVQHLRRHVGVDDVAGDVVGSLQHKLHSERCVSMGVTSPGSRPHLCKACLVRGSCRAPESCDGGCQRALAYHRACHRESATATYWGAATARRSRRRPHLMPNTTRHAQALRPDHYPLRPLTFM